MAELAYVFKWQPSELQGMELDELLQWHAQAMRIQRDVNAAP